MEQTFFDFECKDNPIKQEDKNKIIIWTINCLLSIFLDIDNLFDTDTPISKEEIMSIPSEFLYYSMHMIQFKNTDFKQEENINLYNDFDLRFKYINMITKYINNAILYEIDNSVYKLKGCNNNDININKFVHDFIWFKCSKFRQWMLLDLVKNDKIKSCAKSYRLNNEKIYNF